MTKKKSFINIIKFDNVKRNDKPFGKYPHQKYIDFIIWFAKIREAFKPYIILKAYLKKIF